ncbi:MAG TPA: DUF2974 domain-containing protein [Clostridiaceae bacterium]|nr:DUF2974 domain-containing protein [Clostridiaceae bacterium]
MKDIIEYAEKELRTIDEKPFNSVDSLILSQFAYFNFDGLIPGPEDNAPPVRIGDLYKAEYFSSMLNGLFYIDKNRRLFFAMAASPRFRDIKMNYYVNKLDYESEKQFSAVTYLLPDETCFVAYRGTDMSFVGWKEDFNMVYKSPIPSQEEGVEYLNAAAGKTSGGIIVGGHSKGGNIAVYSSMYCSHPVRDRITAVYSHDGPGFKEDIFKSSAFMEIKDRIHKIIPQSSIIGMLLQVQENYQVVESKRFWIMQHDPFSWIIEKGDFRYAKTVANSSLNVNHTINQWLNGISAEKRELFIDALYHVISSTNAKSVSDLSEVRISDLATILKAFRNIDRETRKFVVQTLRELIVLYVRNLSPLSKRTVRPSSLPSDNSGNLRAIDGTAK